MGKRAVHVWQCYNCKALDESGIVPMIEGEWVKLFCASRCYTDTWQQHYKTVWIDDNLQHGRRVRATKLLPLYLKALRQLEAFTREDNVFLALQRFYTGWLPENKDSDQPILDGQAIIDRYIPEWSEGIPKGTPGGLAEVVRR